MMKTHPVSEIAETFSASGIRAEFIFRPNLWDTAEGGHPAGRPRFFIHPSGSSYRIVMQGGAKAGRRYSSAMTYEDAVETGLKWAARRFRVMEPASL